MTFALIEDSLEASVDERHNWQVLATVELHPEDRVQDVILALVS